MKSRRHTLFAGAVLASLTLVAAACGSSGSGSASASPSATTTKTASSATVTVANSNLGNVLVDAQGRTLYHVRRRHGHEQRLLGCLRDELAAARGERRRDRRQRREGLVARGQHPFRRHAAGHLQRSPAVPLRRRQEGRRHERSGRQRVRRQMARTHRYRQPGHRDRSRAAAAMATNAPARLSLRTIDSSGPAAPAVFAFGALIFAAYVLGAVALAGEAAVHIQQYESLLHGVPGIGPLFLLNAAVSIAAIAGLVFSPTRSPRGTHRCRDLRGRARRPRRELRARILRMVRDRLSHPRRTRRHHRAQRRDLPQRRAHRHAPRTKRRRCRARTVGASPSEDGGYTSGSTS